MDGAMRDPIPFDSRSSREDRLRALGSQVRALRRDRGLSTAELVTACGVSRSMISQVERGLAAPSLELLWALARALDVPIGTFFQGSEADPSEPEARPPAVGGQGRATVVRAGERKRLGLTPSLTYQLLSPDLQHRIELVWIEYGPGESGPVTPFVHAGEEQMVVIQGRMQMWIAGELYPLSAGDSITFDSALPHRALNPYDQPATVIAAITPPSF
jgi:transcriptional regulator with XRE-family HTH domain